MSDQAKGSSPGAPVLVAVNGSDGSLAAVRYGAALAARAGCDLQILHVAPTYLPISGLVPTAGTVGIDEFESVGREILTMSAEPAYTILPRDRVTTRLELGYRVPTVIEEAAHARLLVVGDDRTPIIERITVGGFIGAVAARTPVPLVSVPAGWTDEPKDGAERRVVLAIKDPQRIPFELLRAGFQAAADRDATLEIIHVWDLPTGYGALVTSLMDDPAVQTMIERSIRHLAFPLREEFPDVSYTTSSRYGQPAHILYEEGRNADLLLLARRAHGFPFGHFGATGRALLREGTCPIEIVPIAERSPESTLQAHRAPEHTRR